MIRDSPFYLNTKKVIKEQWAQMKKCMNEIQNLDNVWYFWAAQYVWGTEYIKNAMGYKAAKFGYIKFQVIWMLLLGDDPHCSIHGVDITWKFRMISGFSFPL